MPGQPHLRHACALPNLPLPKRQPRALVQRVFNSRRRISLWPVNQNVLQQRGRRIATALVYSTPVVRLCLLGGLQATLILKKHLGGGVNLSLSRGVWASFWCCS